MPPVDLLMLVDAAPPCTRVIIDGNNFLYSQSPRYGDHLAEGFPGDAHQAALIQHAIEVAGARADLLFDLWFDHPVASEAQLRPNLRLLHSGGKGKDRADRAILKFLHEREPDPAAPPPMLLTLDKGLHKRGRRHRAYRPAEMLK